MRFVSFWGGARADRVICGADKGVYERQCLFGKKQACVQRLLRWMGEQMFLYATLWGLLSLRLLVGFGKKDMKGLLGAECSEIWEKDVLMSWAVLSGTTVVRERVCESVSVRGV